LLIYSHVKQLAKVFIMYQQFCGITLLSYLKSYLFRFR